jgi:hypothetical protein
MTPKLLVREGVNDDEPLVSLIERSDREEGHTLAKAFERVAAGEANKEDRSLVRRALIEGSLTLEQVDSSVTVEATRETSEEVSRTGTKIDSKSIATKEQITGTEIEDVRTGTREDSESIEESSTRIGIKEDVRRRGGIAPEDRSKDLKTKECSAPQK